MAMSKEFIGCYRDDYQYLHCSRLHIFLSMSSLFSSTKASYVVQLSLAKFVFEFVFLWFGFKFLVFMYTLNFFSVLLMLYLNTNVVSINTNVVSLLYKK